MSITLWRLGAFTFLGAAASVHLGAEVPTFDASAHLVQVVVSVTDRDGRGVNDLRAEEFEVKDDRDVQPIAFFQPPFGSASSGRAYEPSSVGDSAPSRRPIVHRTAIVFEPLKVDNRQRSIRAVQAYVGARFRAGEGHAMAIVDGARLVQDFVDDPEPIRRALAEMATRAVSPALVPGLNDWTAAIVDLLQRMEKQGGRKSLVLFVDFGAAAPHALWPDRFIRASVAMYPVDARGLSGLVPFGDAASGSELGYGGFGVGSSAAGPSIAADLSGRSSALADLAAELRAAASATGGRALVNANDFEEVFKLMEENSRGLYVLGYALERSKMDGRFHRIRVKVSRPGTTVRTKEGYFAPVARD